MDIEALKAEILKNQSKVILPESENGNSQYFLMEFKKQDFAMMFFCMGMIADQRKKRFVDIFDKDPDYYLTQYKKNVSVKFCYPITAEDYNSYESSFKALCVHFSERESDIRQLTKYYKKITLGDEKFWNKVDLILDGYARDLGKSNEISLNFILCQFIGKIFGSEDEQKDAEDEILRIADDSNYDLNPKNLDYQLLQSVFIIKENKPVLTYNNCALFRVLYMIQKKGYKLTFYFDRKSLCLKKLILHFFIILSNVYISCFHTSIPDHIISNEEGREALDNIMKRWFKLNYEKGNLSTDAVLWNSSEHEFFKEYIHDNFPDIPKSFDFLIKHASGWGNYSFHERWTQMMRIFELQIQIQNAAVCTQNKPKVQNVPIEYKLNEKYLSELENQVSDLREKNLNLSSLLNEQRAAAKNFQHKLEETLNKLDSQQQTIEELEEALMQEEQDTNSNDKISDEDRAFIANHKIVLVGGHCHLHKMINEEFPHIRCIEVEAPTVDFSFLRNADLVCYLPHYLSHSTFAAARNVCVPNKVPQVCCTSNNLNFIYKRMLDKLR